MIIISGATPGLCGTGKVVTHLIREAKNYKKSRLKFYFKRQRWPQTLRKLLLKADISGLAKELFERILIMREARLWSLRDKTIFNDRNVILIHPQNLGFKFCINMIETRRFPTWIALFDTHYFCARSYNYIPFEQDSCTRCLTGDWKWMEKFDCMPWPANDPHCLEYMRKLLSWASIGKVKFFAIDELQAKMVRKHFGNKAVIRTLGLWASDWNESDSFEVPKQHNSADYDVVFHGNPFSAKGVFWALNIARHCQNLKFLFPFSEKHLKKTVNVSEVSNNCKFVEMKWETGLKDAIIGAKCVLNPTLWSAPIEGALVKSIFAARMVATTDEPTAYPHMLPDGLILKLSRNDFSGAAQILNRAIGQGWRPEPSLYRSWILEFTEANKSYLERIVSAVLE